MEANQVDHLIQDIYSHYGYDLSQYTKSSLHRRFSLSFAKSGLRDFSDFHRKIVEDANFFTEILEELLVVVTEMFRDPSVYLFLRARVIPILRTYPLLRIWHCGVATGEEAYASAILLSEEGLYDRTQIYATDISLKALERAKQGTYDLKTLALSRKNYETSGGTLNFDHYFMRSPQYFLMNDDLKRNMVFFQHNLVSDHVFGEMHLIFCRNVLIYFEQELKEKIVRKLTEGLCPLGFLCLGSSEQLPLQKSIRRHFSEFSTHAHIYRYEG